MKPLKVNEVFLSAGIIILSLFSFPSLGQISWTAADSAEISRMSELANEYSTSNLDSTFYYLDALKQKYWALEYWEGIIETGSRKTIACLVNDRVRLARELLVSNDSLIAVLENRVGASIGAIKRRNEADWAGYYMNLGRLDAAMSIYSRLCTELKALPNKTKSDWLDLYSYHFNLGNVYRLKGSYDQALGLLLNSLDYFKIANEKPGQPTSRGHPMIHRFIAGTYNAKGDKERAAYYYQQSLESLDQMFLDYGEENPRLNQWAVTIYLDAGNMYRTQGAYEQAFQHYERARSYTKGDETRLKRIYNHYGEVYLEQKNYEKALEFYNRSLALSKKDYEGKHHGIGVCLNNIGRVLLEKGQYEEALAHFQSALSHLSNDFESSDFLNNPSLDQAFFRRSLLTALNLKSKSLHLLSQQYPTTIDYTRAAFSTASLAIDLVDTLKTGISSREDKQNLVAYSYPIFERAIQMALQMGEEGEALAFQFAERSRAAILFEAVRNAQAQSFAGVDEHILEREQQLGIELARWQELLYLEKMGKKKETLINQYLKEIANLNKLQKELTNQLERDHADYYRLKYEHSVSPVEVIQSELGKDQAFLEYFVGDDAIFAFLIKSNDFKVFRIDHEFDLEDLVNKMLNGIYHCQVVYEGYCPESVKQNMDKDYADAAFKLYERLLKPFEKELTERLVIVPDGLLGYVPFGALLRSQPSVFTDFKTHDYLERKHIISYAYSASLLSEMKIKQKQRASRPLLALALDFQPPEDQPIFARTDQLADADPGESNQVGKRTSELSPLQFTIAESQDVAELFGGDMLTNEEATIEAFFEQARAYQIIHLATHAKANDREGNFSFLALTAADGAHYDSLYVKDLYNLRLPADMVVLSSCETGIGQLQRGEGIISLARGFSFAGAKSIITTLWSINDKKTRDIIIPFYKQLRKKKSKDQALQEAKLNYIDHIAADHSRAHPVYWAAFSAIGDMQPLSLSLFPLKKVLLGAFLIVVVLYGMMNWRRNAG